MNGWTEQDSWGVIRYAPASGPMPGDDAAAFDGWYYDRDDALAVAEDWKTRFPQWIVALVSSEVIAFGNGDFSGIYPLTQREHFLMIQPASQASASSPASEGP